MVFFTSFRFGRVWKIIRHTKCIWKIGWYVKEVGERNSVFQTFCYLLSHCGIQKDYQAVTWFGSLSYSKLHVPKEPRITKCPLCNEEFQKICYEEPYHPVILPDKH